MDTLVIGDNLAKVVSWYDNEWGYSVRVADSVRRPRRTCGLNDVDRFRVRQPPCRV